MDDHALIDAARSGDLTAFNRLVLAHQDQVYHLCLRILGRTQAAEDATQEAFFSAWRNIGRMQGYHFRPWIMRIASNACMDQLRSRKRRPTEPLEPAVLGEPVIDPADPDRLPEQVALDRELGRALADAMDQLSPEHRLALVLCDVQGLPYEEIAEVTGAALGTVKSRINRARAALRTIVLAQHPELLPDHLRQVERTT